MKAALSRPRVPNMSILMELVDERARAGELLVLVDTIHEIPGISSRRIFCGTLGEWANDNEVSRIALTSRPEGFDLVERDAPLRVDLINVAQLDRSMKEQFCRQLGKLINESKIGGQRCTAARSRSMCATAHRSRHWLRTSSF